MRKLLTIVIFLSGAMLSRVHAQENASGQSDTLKRAVTTSIDQQVAQRDTVIRSRTRAMSDELNHIVRDGKRKTTLRDSANKLTPADVVDVNINSPEDDVKKMDEEAKQQVAGLEDDASDVADDVKKQADQITNEAEHLAKPDGKKVVEDNAAKFQYDSENPENAPWKDLSGGTKSKSLADPSAGIEPAANFDQLGEGVKNLPSSVSANAKSNTSTKSPFNSLKTSRAGAFVDSVASLRTSLEGDDLKSQLANSNKVHSDQYKKRVYDSLGVEKADSIFQVAAAVAKTETPKEELLGRINESMSGKQMGGVGFDPSSDSLRVADAEKLQGVPDEAGKYGDLSQLKLPDSVLSELEPLRGRKIDSEYLPVVDSLRDQQLALQNQSLDEKSVSGNLKRTSVTDKLRFNDKVYFEGIIGFMNDSAVNIIQVSPAFAYHFTDFLSLGVGPNILVQLHEKKLSLLGGLRTFIKAELWKQRVYLQVEDNINQTKFTRESAKVTGHAILVGGGGIVPVSKSLGFNVAVFYRINNSTEPGAPSPWVVRLGISSIKKVNSKRR
jgi:hypothetical protein